MEDLNHCTNTPKTPPVRAQPLPSSCTHAHHNEVHGEDNASPHPVNRRTTAGPSPVCIQAETWDGGRSGMPPPLPPPPSPDTKPLSINPVRRHHLCIQHNPAAPGHRDAQTSGHYSTPPSLDIQFPQQQTTCSESRYSNIINPHHQHRSTSGLRPQSISVYPPHK